MDDKIKKNICHNLRYHNSIKAIQEVDKNKIKKQENLDDLHFEQREEFKRKNKINNITKNNKLIKEPWLDVRFYDETKDYEHYCVYCEVFARKKHEKSREHWRNFTIIFMNDFKSCLFESK